MHEKTININPLSISDKLRRHIIYMFVCVVDKLDVGIITLSVPDADIELLPHELLEKYSPEHLDLEIEQLRSVKGYMAGYLSDPAWEYLGHRIAYLTPIENEAQI